MDLPIAKSPWTRLGKKLESALRKALFDYNMLDEKEDTIALALSGGKDSLTLLYLLKAVLGRGMPHPKLIAIHIDGEFSCGSSVKRPFLSKICKEMGVPLIVKTSFKKKEDLKCYSCSRERRKMIFDAAKEYGAKRIAFGHHLDDSIQTLLLNLLHKAEFAQNMPKIFMKNYGVTIIRPLIYIAEKEIIQFAKLYGFMRITCQCPIGQNSKRKVVSNLIKDIENYFPNARNNLFFAAKKYGSDKALDS